MIGRTLSHFTVTAKLGEGGMGAVYQATDTRLGREVAIKMLPRGFTDDPPRLARLEREGRVLASIEHSNIAGIHEIGEALVDGSTVRFLIMELASGETLAERIARGAIPLDEALAISLQIATGLEVAHQQSIVHRDLKPANIKVDEDGQVKILDFGLAVFWGAPGESGSDLADSPTLTAPITQAGTVLGTAAYMSPEQARGQQVDRRTDVWAFGGVLYEMLSGQPAFPGETSTDRLASTLEREPDWDQLPGGTPVAIRTLIRRCLAKDPQRRLHDIADARLEIEDALIGPSDDLAAPPPAAQAKARFGLFAGLLALGAAALAAFLIWTVVASEELPASTPARLSLSLDRAVQMAEIEPQMNGVLALAPDGSILAFLGRTDDTSKLYLLRLDGEVSTPVPDTEGVRAPFFSPDSGWLGFLDGNELKAIPLAGGAPVTLGLGFGRSRASWADEGIVFSNPDGIFRVEMPGGQPIRIAAPAVGRMLKDPFLLPGGDAVLLASRGKLMDDPSRVEVLSADTGERRVLVESGGSPTFVPSKSSAGAGYLVYGLRGQLFAAPLDLDRLELTGPAVAVVENVQMRPTGDAAQYSFSSTGTLVYLSQEGISELVWVDPGGGAKRLSSERRVFAMPRLSPDGSLLAVEVHEVPHQIWLLDIAKDLLSRITSEHGNHYFVWHPDGRSIVYTSDTGDTSDGVKLLWKRVDSPGEPVTVYSGEANVWITSLSRDGRLAAFHEHIPDRDYDVFLLPLDGGAPPRVTGPPIPVATSRFTERDPSISPDGECVAYSSTETGTGEIYVECLEEQTRQQISVSGGLEPLWSKTGEEIYFRSEYRMMAVDVEREPKFRAGTPRLLFEGIYRHFSPANFDVTTDGRRFVRLRSVADSDSARYLPVRFDWFDELEARAGETVN